MLVGTSKNHKNDITTLLDSWTLKTTKGEFVKQAKQGSRKLPAQQSFKNENEVCFPLRTAAGVLCNDIFQLQEN